MNRKIGFLCMDVKTNCKVKISYEGTTIMNISYALLPLGILVFLRNYACQKEKFVVKLMKKCN